MKKKILAGVLVVLVLGVAFLQFASGGILGEMLFDRPAKPKVKHGEFPFQLVYEFEGQQYTVNETIVCDYKGVSFALDGGNTRDWDCYVTNNDRYGRYYLDEANRPTLYIQVPLEAEYYMGMPDAKVEYTSPYIFFVDDSTGTTHYAEDLMDVAGVKLISWQVSGLLTDNIK